MPRRDYVQTKTMASHLRYKNTAFPVLPSRASNTVAFRGSGKTAQDRITYGVLIYEDNASSYVIKICP